MNCPPPSRACCEADRHSQGRSRSQSAARAFLADKNPDAAQRAAASLIDAIQSLDTFSARGRPTDIDGVRELIVPFGSSAYVLRYAHLSDTDEVIVLRIWHGREQRE